MVHDAQINQIFSRTKDFVSVCFQNETSENNIASISSSCSLVAQNSCFEPESVDFDTIYGSIVAKQQLSEPSLSMTNARGCLEFRAVAYENYKFTKAAKAHGETIP